jgi:hypothetical protein
MCRPVVGTLRKDGGDVSPRSRSISTLAVGIVAVLGYALICGVLFIR